MDRSTVVGFVDAAWLQHPMLFEAILTTPAGSVVIKKAVLRSLTKREQTAMGIVVDNQMRMFSVRAVDVGTIVPTPGSTVEVDGALWQIHRVSLVAADSIYQCPSMRLS